MDDNDDYELYEVEFTRSIAIVNGVPNDSCITAFTEGDCWALAIVLSEMTSWPCVCIGVTDAYASDEWGHVMVLMPDGMLLDITGPRHPDEVDEIWGSGQWERGIASIKDDMFDTSLIFCADWDVVRNVASVLLWNLQQRSPVQASTLVV